MCISRPLQFVHHVYSANTAIRKSHCSRCCVLVAAATKDKFLAIAEAVHKCRIISVPRLTNKDLTRLH